MDRTEFQSLSDERMLDTEHLLAGGRWSAAYYLVGYAVECALKACIVRYLENKPGAIFDDRRFLDKCWTHEMQLLLAAADLTDDYNVSVSSNPALRRNWEILSMWKEKARYAATSEAKARELFDAVAEPTNGVLQWIKSRW